MAGKPLSAEDVVSGSDGNCSCFACEECILKHFVFTVETSAYTQHGRDLDEQRQHSCDRRHVKFNLNPSFFPLSCGSEQEGPW